MVQYNCSICNYTTNAKCSYEQHKKELEHESSVIKIYHICECGKRYSYHSGLSRHRRVCKVSGSSKEIDSLKKIIQLKDEQHKNELIKAYESCNISTTNTTNNIICSEEFLKKHCGEAMNLPEFIESIVLGINDILYSGKHGYELGMANILNTRLKTLGSSKRPIHCTDTKRKKFVVKSENKWRCDKDNELLLEGVKKLDNKQYSALKNWDDEKNDTGTFFEVVQGITPTYSTKKLLKGLTSHIEMKDAMRELGV
jgi:hypothetical protein